MNQSAFWAGFMLWILMKRTDHARRRSPALDRDCGFPIGNVRGSIFRQPENIGQMRD